MSSLRRHSSIRARSRCIAAKYGRNNRARRLHPPTRKNAH
jgi:hypothetical protein